MAEQHDKRKPTKDEQIFNCIKKLRVCVAQISNSCDDINKNARSSSINK